MQACMCKTKKLIETKLDRIQPNVAVTSALFHTFRKPFLVWKTGKAPSKTKQTDRQSADTLSQHSLTYMQTDTQTDTQTNTQRQTTTDTHKSGR